MIKQRTLLELNRLRIQKGAVRPGGEVGEDRGRGGGVRGRHSRYDDGTKKGVL